MNLVDSHCHLDNPKFAADIDGVMERAAKAGVNRMLSIGTGEGPLDMDCALKVAARHENVFATAGIHPHDASKADHASFALLTTLIREPKCLAVGEIGLDFHYDFSPRDIQQEVFYRQMEIAMDARKPIIIHTREAWTETLRMLREQWQGGPGIFHCFTGTADEALEAVDLGFYVAFGGVLTFPKSDSVREAARLVPMDRLLLETDAPYLAPLPHRGKRNEPAFTAFTAQKLAEVRQCSTDEIAERTTRNFNDLFHLPHGKPNGYTEVSMAPVSWARSLQRTNYRSWFATI